MSLDDVLFYKYANIMGGGALGGIIGYTTSNKLSEDEKRLLKARYGLKQDANLQERNALRGAAGGMLGNLIGNIPGYYTKKHPFLRMLGADVAAIAGGTLATRKYSKGKLKEILEAPEDK